jgi:hypothetical protein
MLKKILLTFAALLPLSASAQVVTPPGFETWMKGEVREDSVLTGNGDSGYVRGLRGYVADGVDSSDTPGMDANVAALRAVSEEGDYGDWGTSRQPIKLKADLFFINDTVHWAARTGWPLIDGAGGEPTYHPLTQYSGPNNPFYVDEAGSFDDGTAVWTVTGPEGQPGTDLSPVLEGAFCYGKTGAGDWAWLSRVADDGVSGTSTGIDDTANTIQLIDTPLRGTYATIGGNGTIHIFGAKGGVPCALVWGDNDYTKSMLDFYGHGGVIKGLTLMGKQSDSGTTLVQDAAGDPYPYLNPFETTRPNENRCKYGIRVRSTAADLGSGKHVFPTGLAAFLCQTAIEATHDDDIFVNHSDQCHVQARFNPAYCDIGFHCREQQAFSWTFRQQELGFCRIGNVISAGGKLTIDVMDMQRECTWGVVINGNNNSAVNETHVSPAGNHVRACNFDETSPANSQMLRVDPSFGGPGGYVNAKTHFGSDTIHVSSARMNHGRAGPYYWEINGTFVAASRTFTADTQTNLLPIQVGDLIRAYTDAGAFEWESVVTSVNDGANTFVVTRIPQRGTYTNRTNDMMIRHYHADYIGGVYEETAGDFVASTETFTMADNSDLSRIRAGDWVYARLDGLYGPLAWVSRVVSVNDGANTFVVTDTTPHSGAYADSTDGLTVSVKSPDDEKPVVHIKNSYGFHVFENGDNFFDRMIKVEGGIDTIDGTDDGAIPHIIVRNCEFAAGQHNPSKPADIFTTDSSGYVVLHFVGNFEEHASSGSNHGAKFYDDYRKKGSLSNGVFTEDETWP